MYLIPNPALLQEKEGRFTLTYDCYIQITPGCSGAVCEQTAIFCEKVEKMLGFAPMQGRGNGICGDIVLKQITPEEVTWLAADKKGNKSAEKYADLLAEEAYKLEITPCGITVTGTEKGLWYGLQTLLQMISQEGSVLPACYIEDAPSIPDRGYYFDCTRGRIVTLDWLKKLADCLAYYKMNQLQLYVEHTYLFRNLTALWRDDTPLTAAEIMELDRYCAVRGIELVPSLSSFGHLYKLLATKDYAHLCELEGSVETPFSVRGRMMHHTINVADPESLVLIRSMLKEYMELFTTKRFNLCADETFDLGRGKSKEYIDKVGKDRAYIDFVKAIAEYIVEEGRIPMFWGDIVCECPELFHELPKEIICLGWGYDANQTDNTARLLANVNATQYCCPGCSSWNQMLPVNYIAYNNIYRQCNYARQYGALGLLNTDWGDYMHVSHPDFSKPGLIYGAAFSWSDEILPYEEINKQISVVEYKDREGAIVSLFEKTRGTDAYRWWEVCHFYELRTGVMDVTSAEVTEKWMVERKEAMQNVDVQIAKLDQVKVDLYAQMKSLDESTRAMVMDYIVSVDGLRLFNLVGKLVYAEHYGLEYETLPERGMLAAELETWLYHYKAAYRKISKEGELRRLERMVCWYSDYVRG